MRREKTDIAPTERLCRLRGNLVRRAAPTPFNLEDAPESVATRTPHRPTRARDREIGAGPAERIGPG